jgi:hypothetical protein
VSRIPRNIWLAVVLSIFASASTVISARAQSTGATHRDLFPTSRWCEDDGTACWWDPDDHASFTGIRFLAEIDLAILFQGGGNRFEGGSIRNHTKLAVEVNLYRSWVSLQLAVMAPSTVILDSRSPAVNKLQDSTTRVVNTDWGGFLGLSFLDSSVAFGLGRFRYDRRDFRVLTPCTRDQLRDTNRIVARADCSAPGDSRDTFWYFAFQPISTLRANLKSARDDADDTGNVSEMLGPRP